MQEPELLGTAEMIQKFYVSDRTLLNWRKKGLLPYLKMGRLVYYRTKDIEKLIDDKLILRRPNKNQ